MFFQNCKPFKIIDVYKVKRESKGGFTEGRERGAIAFRSLGHSLFESGGKSYSADEGSVLYIPSGVSFLRKGSAEELIIIHIKCFDDTKNIEVLKPKNASLIEQSFNAVYEEWNSKKIGYDYRCTAMLYTLLSQLKTQTTQSLPPYQSEMILPGKDMINSEFSDPTLTVKRVAEACNISEEYFRALYKAEYGISPHNAISDRRIKKAKRLLRTGYFSVAEVAEECGFPNAKYFSVLFRKKTGVSPREYKVGLGEDE